MVSAPVKNKSIESLVEIRLSALPSASCIRCECMKLLPRDYFAFSDIESRKTGLGGTLKVAANSRKNDTLRPLWVTLWYTHTTSCNSARSDWFSSDKMQAT
jgi:hypothetical protein